jgi:hypothetical protein
MSSMGPVGTDTRLAKGRAGGTNQEEGDALHVRGELFSTFDFLIPGLPTFLRDTMKR